MKYYFLGIKGSGMAALATILYDKGNTVIGYDDDPRYAHTMEGLVKRDIKIYYDDSFDLKDKDIIVVYTAALTMEHKEMKRCSELGLKMYSYFEAVGLLTREHKTICVSGCHGKTTTSSMLAHVFDDTIGSSYIVGDGTGKLNNDSEYLVLESCEYRRHFLEYDPYITIVTNVDLDHVDYYKDMDDMKSAYVSLINNTRTKALVCIDDKEASTLVNDKIIFYGTDDKAYYKAKNIISNNKGITFDYYIGSELKGTYTLPIFGQHNLLNTLAVLSLTNELNMDLDSVINSLKTFKGAKRRFNEEFINNYVFIDDYAHHPNEVNAVIDAVKQKYDGYRLYAFFQGHTFSRVKEFYKDFAKVLSKCDEVILVKISKAREKESDFPGISMSLIKDELPNSYLEEEYDFNRLKTDDKTVILFMSPSTMKEHIDKVKEVIK